MSPTNDMPLPVSKPKKKRILYFDVLNVVACVCVLYMHFNVIVHKYTPTPEWHQSLIVECLAYWAVPVFFMLTGATLLGYRARYDTKTFFRKRAARVFVPFIVWSVVFLVWSLATGHVDMPAHLGPRTVIMMLLNCDGNAVYWFFIALFSIYLALPVLSLLAKQENERVLWYAVICTFVLVSVLPCLFRLVGMEWNAGLTFPMFGGYLMLPVLGWLLSRHEFTRTQRIWLYAAGATCLVVRYVGTAVLSDAEGQLNDVFWGYLNFPGVVYSAAVFVFARYVNWDSVFRSDRSRSALSKVAGCSFGIYLVHMFVFYYSIPITGLYIEDPVFRWVLPPIAYAICLVAVLLMKRIPLLRRLVP